MQVRTKCPAGPRALALCAMLFVAGFVHADVPGIAPDTALVLAGDAGYPPFQFLDERGHATGFDIELFRALAQQQQLQIEVRLGDWRTAVHGLDSGSVDVVPMFITPARQQRYLFSRAFLIRYHLVFGHRDQAHVSSLADLAGRRVAVQFDSTAREALEALDRVVQIVPCEVEGGAVDAVHNGQADYALVPIEIGYKTIVDRDYRDVVAISPPLLEREYAYAVPRGRGALLARINAGLAALRSNGTQDALYLEWLANLAPDPGAGRQARWLHLALVGLGVFFAVALAMWLRANRRASVQTNLAAAESRSRQDAEARVEHLAWHDAATDLPNLNALLTRMQEAVRAHRRFALVRLDIMRLNLTQATAGSRFTEDLLRALAQRLAASCRGGMVASLGRGLFGVVIEPVQGNHDAEQHMQALVEAVHRPLKLGELTLQQRCRAGLAYYPLDARDAEGMLRAAETACSAAHEHATTAMVYEEHLEPDPRNLTLLADLAEAIANGSLACAMQPKHALTDGRFCGAELLLRWQHPRYGALAPGVFVPLAEKTGAIGELTMYVVRAALAEWQHWRAHGVVLPVAVNISGNDLANEPLIEGIVASCSDIGTALTLEITETEMIRDPQRALAAVARLRGTGLRISLDDFGTGYSSFTTLRQLAPDELKIDRTFIAHLLESGGDQAIVRACIALAHELGAKVVAEGVEDRATLEWLGEHGCDIVQGYVIAAPMPAGELFMRYAGVAPA